MVTLYLSRFIRFFDPENIGVNNDSMSIRSGDRAKIRLSWHPFKIKFVTSLIYNLQESPEQHGTTRGEYGVTNSCPWTNGKGFVEG